MFDFSDSTSKGKGRKAPKGGMSKKELSRKGSAIMDEAKRIRKANPGKVWKTCVAEAGRSLGKK